MIYQSVSTAATAAFAERLVRNLTHGGVLQLVGELGAGKTTFVQGLARTLGITQTVTSPTFIVVQTYPIPNHPFLQRLVHADLYRLAEPKQLIDLDLNQYATDPQTLFVVEWPDRNPDAWPNDLGTIEFTVGDLDHRTLTATGQAATLLR